MRETKKVLGLNGDAKLGKSEFKKSGCKSLEKKNVWGDTHFFFRPPKLKIFFRKVCRQIHPCKSYFYYRYVYDFKRVFWRQEIDSELEALQALEKLD